jgi:hypothetical protein
MKKTNRSFLEPMRKETFEKMVAGWARIINNKECGSIYHYSRAGLLRRLYQLQNDTKLYSKYFGKKKFLLIDLSSFVIEEEEDLIEIFDKSLTPDFYIIIGLDSLLRERNKAVLSFLEKKSVSNPETPFLLFFSLDFTHPQFWPLINQKSIFSQNIFLQPLYQKEDTGQFIDYLSNKWPVILSHKTKKAILDQCGSHWRLVKEAVRYLRDNPGAKKDDVFSHEAMKMKIESTWDSFLPSEKKALNNLINGQESRDDFTGHSLKFLEKTGWLTENKTPRLTISLLETFIRNQRQTFQLQLTEGNIVLNKVNITTLLSREERKALVILLNNKGKVVNRDKVGEAVWGDKVDSKYSDWAIDQLMSRLRQKIGRLGIPKKIIKTHRNQGFSLKI